MRMIKKLTSVLLSIAMLCSTTSNVFVNVFAEGLTEKTYSENEVQTISEIVESESYIVGDISTNEESTNLSTIDTFDIPNIGEEDALSLIETKSKLRVMVKYNTRSSYEYPENGVATLYNIQNTNTSDESESAIEVILGTSAEINQMKESDDISYMEVDAIARTSSAYPLSWNLEEIGYKYLPQHGINGSGIKIAILDTGVDPQYIPVTGGISFVDNTSSYYDDNGHGTTVAGIINGGFSYEQQIGMNLDASIYSVKVMDSEGKGYYSSIISGIYWAIENEMDIVCLSLEGNSYSKFLSDAVSDAFEAGILLIAASGNQGKNELSYPARFGQVLSVGATDEYGQRAEYSNYGYGLDLVAPGKSIPSVLSFNGMPGSYDGTSFAAAHVVGVAACIWSENPNLTNKNIFSVLTHGCVLQGEREEYGNGIINIEKAFSEIESADEYPNINNVEGFDPGKYNGDIEAYIAEVHAGNNQWVKKGDTVYVRAKVFDTVVHTAVAKVYRLVAGTWTLYHTLRESEVIGSSAGNPWSVEWITTSSTQIGQYQIRFEYSNGSDDDVFDIYVYEDDEYEPNDDSFDAYALSRSEAIGADGEEIIATISHPSYTFFYYDVSNPLHESGTVVEKDADVYKIDLYVGESINVDLLLPDNVDYDLYLYNSDLRTVESSKSTDNIESIIYTVENSSEEGTYYIFVEGYQDTDWSTEIYGLIVSIDPHKDEYENHSKNGTTYNSNDTISQSTALGSITDSLILEANISRSADVDFYSVYLPENTNGKTTDIVLSDMPETCDYDLIVYNASGVVVDESYNGLGSDDFVIINVPTSGMYYICIKGYNSFSATESYTLSIYYEKIHDLFFEVTSKNSIGVTWNTAFSGNSKVNYGTTAVMGNSVLSSSLTQNHSLIINSLAPMTEYYVQAESSVGSSSGVTATIVSAPDTIYSPDIHEPNGTISKSKYVYCEDAVTGTLVSYNGETPSDYYSTHAPYLGYLNFDLVSPEGYDYDLTIYDSETGYMLYIPSSGSILINPGQTYYFAVTSSNGTVSPGEAYVLSFDFTRLVSIVDEYHYGGEGVYTPTGNYSRVFSDLIANYNDEKISFDRTYNSKDSYSAHFGRGWIFSYEGNVKDLVRTVVNIDGSEIEAVDRKIKKVRFGNGTTALFELQSDNTNYEAIDSRNVLVKNSDGTFMLTTPENDVYSYNTDGYLTLIKDKNGNETVITVDENGKVIRVTDERGRTYTVSYGENGCVSAITDNTSGRSATYQYDASKNLISATDSAGNVDNYTYYTSGNKAGYLYQVKDSYGNVLVELDYDTTANGSYPISSMTDEFGTEYAYTYSDENKVTTITEVVEDGTPRITTQAYDDKKYITTETFPDGKTQVIEYHLTDGENKYGEPAKITDRNGNVTEYERDDNGNVIKIVNPDGTTSEALYDDKNNVVWTLDETGVFTRYTYDDYKINLLKQSVYLEKLASDDTKPELTDSNTDDFITVQYSYADLPYKGLVSSITDGNGNTTSYTYDSSYNLESVINPESNTEEPIVTRYEYNTMGLKSAEISPTGNRTEYQYDNNGNITQKKVITDGGTEITQYLYDLNGNVIAEKAPNQVAQNGNGVVYTYYPSGKLHTKTDAAGYVYTYTYDKYGNISSITNPDGSIKSYEYDSVNRQIAEHFKESANSTAVLISETSYAVSDNNEIVTIKKYIDDINYLTDISVYDYDGKLVSHSANGILDETNTYYGNRLLKNSTDGNGNDIHYTYFNYDSSTDELYDEKWIEVSDGLYAYEKAVYDLAGNVTKILKSTLPVALNTVPSQNLIIEEYQYYKDNLLKQATDNEGRKVIYTYDANRHMSGAEQYYSNTGKNVVKVAYDHNGKLLSQKAYVDGDYVGNTSSDSLGEYIEQTYSYDGNGNVSSETSPAGHTVTYTYDGNNRKLASSEQGTDENDALVTVTNTWQYDYRDKVVSQTDAKGNVTKYIYDKFGNLVYSIDASSGVTFAVYDRLGRITAKVTPENYTGTVTLSNATLDSYETDVAALSSMNRTEYTYNAFGLVLSETERFTDPITNESVSISKSYTYDNNGNILTETDGMGYVTTYAYNGLNKCVSVLDAEGAYRDLPYSVSYEYDALGRMTAERKYNSSELEYTYNNVGKTKTVRAKKDGAFFVQQEYTYDLADNMISAKDGNGNEKTYTYNALGLVQSETLPSDSSIASKTTTYYYDGNGNITKTVDTTGKEVINTYNFKKFPVTTVERKTDGTESVTNTFKYDVNGNLRFSTDGNGNIKVIVYDALNRPISETVIGSSYAKITAYDKNGNILSETDGFGNVISYQYDPINRLIKVIDANGTVVETLAYNANHAQTTSKNGLGNVTTFAYDRNNRLVSTTDPLGHTESNVYDDAGNISAKKDGNLNVTSYTYDELGNVKSSSQAIGEQNILISFTYDNNGNLLTQTNGNNHVFTFTYNTANLVSSKYDHDGLGVAVKTETYSYDGNGNMISKTDRNGVTTTFSYDVHGNQTGRSASDVSVTKTYDSNGNVLSMTDNSGVTAYTYDALDRVLTKNVSGVGSLLYQYDITEGLEDGYFAEKQTDSKGNVVTKVYDKNCRIYQVKDGDVVSATHTYNADGSLEKIVYANGSGEYYSYYDDNTLQTLTNKKSDDTIVDTYSYTYDAAGNQTSKTETVDGVLLGTIEYTYDSANRLSTVTEPTGKVTAYTYDGAGNRVSETVTLGEETVTTVYSYNEQERLISKVEESQNRTKTTTYCYDNNGNQYSSSVEWLETADYIPSGLDLVILGVSDDSNLGEINGFNSQNQIVVTYVGDKTIWFSYNGDGIRVGKNVNGNIEKYLYDTGNHVVLEVNADGEQIAENIYGIYNVARVVDGESYTYLHNGHGDVVALIDSEENVVNRYTYDAFGVVITETETVDNPFRYASYWYDSETGLYYLMARYYNPVNGRFLSEDPARDGYNWYVYCNNNPLIYVDPNGQFIITTTALVIIGLATAGAVVGGIVGNYFAEKNGATGWEKAGYIAGGSLGGAAVGAVGGYFAAPAIVSATGVSAISVSGAGISAIASGSGAAIKTTLDKAEPIIGDKINYIFGKATGSIHNIQRSAGMLKELNRIGISDNESGRTYVAQKIIEAYHNAKPIIQEGGRCVREILIMGPNGGAKLETIWEGVKLITVKIIGGK